MHTPRFFLTANDVQQGQYASPSGSPLDLNIGQTFDITAQSLTNQITNVLRMRQGDPLVVLNGTGRLYRCHILNMKNKTVQCSVDEAEAATGDPPVAVSVAVAMLKGERFDWCLQKLTELGVASVIPLQTRRTIVKISDSTTGDAKGTKGKIERWQAILKEAAEQCERATVPHIVPPKKYEDFIRSLAGGGDQPMAFICAERLQSTPLRDICLEYTRINAKDLATAGKTIILIIGPEGGFVPEELAIAQDAGVMPVSLGPRILRAETAAIYALSQLIWCFEK